MRYPTPLVPGAAIGVTAPSSGVSMLAHLKRLDLVLSQLSARGFEIVEGQCLRSDHHHVSAPAAARTKDLQALWMDDRVRAIIPPWGGVLLIDCLHQLDFERLAQSSAPKWLVGYSDTSTLLFAVTSMLDIATAHGPNLMELIDTQPDDLTARTLGCLATRPGEAFEQSSFPRYQTRWTRWDDDRFDRHRPQATPDGAAQRLRGSVRVRQRARPRRSTTRVAGRLARRPGPPRE